MRAALICGTLTTVDCGKGGTDPCASYYLHKDLYDYCVSTRVIAFPDPTSAASFCDQARDPWRSSCRTAWVERAISESTLSKAQLLQFCETDDCRLQVQDGRPDADLLVQLKECETTGKYKEDCRGHAAQFWSSHSPQMSEIQRVATGTTEWAELRSDAIGTALRCLGVNDCSMAPVPERCSVARAKAQADYHSCTSLNPAGAAPPSNLPSKTVSPPAYPSHLPP